VYTHHPILDMDETQVIIDTVANAPNVECEAIVTLFAFMLVSLNYVDNQSGTVGQIHNYSDSGDALNIEWVGRTEHSIERITPQTTHSFFNPLHINISSLFYNFLTSVS
jgi:hypothetical protein